MPEKPTHIVELPLDCPEEDAHLLSSLLRSGHPLADALRKQALATLKTFREDPASSEQLQATGLDHKVAPQGAFVSRQTVGYAILLKSGEFSKMLTLVSYGPEYIPLFADQSGPDSTSRA